MKFKNKIVFKIDNETLPVPVVFIVGKRPNAKELAQISKTHNLWDGVSDAPIECDGFAATWTFHNSGCMVWLSKDKRGTVPLTHFVHELCHVLSYVSNKLGQQMRLDADEMHAYFAEWLTSKFFKRINHERNRLSRKPARRKARTRTAASAC